MTNAAPERRPRPRWSVALAIIGWLIVGLTVAAYVLLLIAMEIDTRQSPSQSDLGALVILTGMAIWVAGIGWLLAIVGRSRRPNVQSGRLKLWARLAIVVGLLFSVGVPVFLGGGLLTESARGDDPEKVHRAIEACLAMGGISLAVGVGLIVSALVWGRLKRPPDVAHVFS